MLSNIEIVLFIKDRNFGIRYQELLLKVKAYMSLKGYSSKIILYIRNCDPDFGTIW